MGSSSTLLPLVCAIAKPGVCRAPGLIFSSGNKDGTPVGLPGLMFESGELDLANTDRRPCSSGEILVARRGNGGLFDLDGSMVIK